MSKSNSLIIALLVILVGAGLARAQLICPLDSSQMKPKEVADLSGFARIPILDEGRIKPLDTYARNLLLRFSGRQGFDKQPAIRWLTRLLFAPELTRDNEVFLINHPDIPTALGVEVKKKRRYSFLELQPGFPKLSSLAQTAKQIEPKERSLADSEIIRLYENLFLYAKLSNAFTFAIPHPDFQIADASTKEALGLPADQPYYSFIDMAIHAEKLYALTQGLERKSKAAWTARDEELITLLSNVFHWPMSYQGLPLLTTPTAEVGDEAWLSSWDAIASGMKDTHVKNEIILMSRILAHYWNGEQLAFDMDIRAYNASLKARVSTGQQKALSTINLEVFYNRLDAFDWARWLYFLVLFIFIISVFMPRKSLHTGAFYTLILGLIPHSFAIISRVIIMARPPVSNLYETFVFVGFVCVVIGLLIERAHKRWLGILVAAVNGFALLTIASKYAAEGDTLVMLVAVLNSNFWLSTHVISITCGYAATCVAGIIGHVYIIQQVIKPREKELLQSTFRQLIFALALALLLTFLGTMLGGIWADQSWGRFWGWDPKENGAIMIVLWIAIIFHAKVAKLIGPLGFAALSAAGIMVVMWAWFGVNLLSIGLHSYGFTSGIAISLSVYYVAEIIFLLISVPLARRKL